MLLLLLVEYDRSGVESDRSGGVLSYYIDGVLYGVVMGNVAFRNKLFPREIQSSLNEV